MKPGQGKALSGSRKAEIVGSRDGVKIVDHLIVLVIQSFSFQKAGLP